MGIHIVAIKLLLFIIFFSGLPVKAESSLKTKESVPLFSSKRNVGEILKTLPVQSGGRVKPFDTFARESLRFVYGKSQFNKRPAVDILMSWILLPEHWNETDFIQVRDSTLRKAIKLDQSKTLFSPDTLLQNKYFIRELAELRTRQQRKESLNDYFKSIQKLGKSFASLSGFSKWEITRLDTCRF